MRLWSYKTCTIVLFGVQAFDRAPSRAVFGVFVKIGRTKRGFALRAYQPSARRVSQPAAVRNETRKSVPGMPLCQLDRDALGSCEEDQLAIVEVHHVVPSEYPVGS